MDMRNGTHENSSSKRVCIPLIPSLPCDNQPLQTRTPNAVAICTHELEAVTVKDLDTHTVTRHCRKAALTVPGL